MAVCKFCNMTELEWVYDPAIKKNRLYTKNGLWHLCTPSPEQLEEWKRKKAVKSQIMETKLAKFDRYKDRH